MPKPCKVSLLGLRPALREWNRTHRHRTEKIIVRRWKLKMLAIPSARQRIMHSTPVLLYCVRVSPNYSGKVPEA